MNAPLIWIVFPVIVSVILFSLNARRYVVVGLATGSNLFLVLLGLMIPIDRLIKLGPWAFEISSTLMVFGRRFVITDSDARLVVFLYFFAAFWFFGAGVIRAHRLFIPIGQCIVALAVAAISVEPFLYAGLLAEVVVLLSVPMLVPPGRRVGQGVLRYLIFQTMALPFVLYAGWVSAGVEANPANQRLLQQGVVLLGLGFAFWLAVFPFHSWVPILVGEAQPYVSGFLLSLLQTVVLLLMLGFLDSFAWLRNFSILSRVLQLIGTIMVASAGIMAAFQRDIARLFGQAVILESGFALLALSVPGYQGAEVFAGFFAGRLLALALWALALSNLAAEGVSFDFDHLKGLLHRLPLTGMAVVLSVFSIAGLPLLASFPVRLMLFDRLIPEAANAAVWVVIGCLGMLIGGIRAMMVLAYSREGWRFEERPAPAILMVIGLLGLIVCGIFPRWIMPYLIQLLDPFRSLGVLVILPLI